MNVRKLLIVMALCAFSGVAAAQNGLRNNSRDFPEAIPTNDRVQMLDQKDELWKLTYLKDVVYATKDGHDLKLQIVMPQPYDDTRKRFPCKDLYADVPQISAMAKRGYVIAIVEYRPSDVATFPAQRDDAVTAIEYMRAHADEYCVDERNIFVWGSSSGAHTALFTGLHIGHDTLPETNGIIAYFPPTDVLHMKDDPTAATKGDAESPEGLLIGRKAVWEAPEAAMAASPLYYIKDADDLPPVFLAHGTKDRVVPFSQSDSLANELEKYWREYEFHALRNADHGSWQFWTPEMLDLVEAFIKEQIEKTEQYNVKSKGSQLHKTGWKALAGSLSTGESTVLQWFLLSHSPAKESQSLRFFSTILPISSCLSLPRPCKGPFVILRKEPRNPDTYR